MTVILPGVPGGPGAVRGRWALVTAVRGRRMRVGVVPVAVVPGKVGPGAVVWFRRGLLRAPKRMGVGGRRPGRPSVATGPRR
ncbi:hypothetical protein GCM10010176_095580 [Nonomuraea spiralis]|nr:hypothetical protein GCM10010176_095580 [Nonomuraea spiralis]